MHGCRIMLSYTVMVHVYPAYYDGYFNTCTLYMFMSLRFRHNTPSIDLHVVFIRLLTTYVAIISLTLYVLLQWLYSWR